MRPLSWGGGGDKLKGSYDSYHFSDLFCFALPHPSVFYAPPPPVTNYMLLYSTLLCKYSTLLCKKARAPGGGGRKKYKPTKLRGGGGGQNRKIPFIIR